MSDELERALRDQGQAFRSPTPGLPGGLDEAVRRGRSRRHRRHGLLSATAVLALAVALTGIRVGTDERVTTGPATQPSTTMAPTTVAPSTTVPPATSVVVVPETTTTATPTTTTTTTKPTTTTTAPSTTTTSAAVTGPSIGPDGVLGVPFGTPMDDAVAQISAQIGPPDLYKTNNAACDGPGRKAQWGALLIMSDRDGQAFDLASYGSNEPAQPDSALRPTLLVVGRLPIGQPARPRAEITDAIRAALGGNVEGDGSGSAFWNGSVRVDLFFGSTADATTVEHVNVYRQGRQAPCE